MRSTGIFCSGDGVCDRRLSSFAEDSRNGGNHRFLLEGLHFGGKDRGGYIREAVLAAFKVDFASNDSKKIIMERQNTLTDVVEKTKPVVRSTSESYIIFVP